MPEKKNMSAVKRGAAMKPYFWYLLPSRERFEDKVKAAELDHQMYQIFEPFEHLYGAYAQLIK